MAIIQVNEIKTVAGDRRVSETLGPVEHLVPKPVSGAIVIFVLTPYCGISLTSACSLNMFKGTRRSGG